MLSALDLARRIEAGELTPLNVVDRCAEAIAASEPEIGAFTALDIEAARRRARDAAVALRASPLRGLPVGFKDIYDTVDFPTEYGSSIYAGHRPRSDAALVAMAKRAGGLILGKTVTTELAFLDPGKTRNPRNTAHTPGGSSSGSAAAIAAGMLPVTFGSQTGGSVIRPAAYCGITGFKPSYRLLPTVGMKAFSWFLDTAGVFAASVADVAFATGAVSGRDLRIDRLARSTPRIAVVRTSIWTDASSDMRTAIEKAGSAAAAKGAKVSGVALPPIMEEAWHAQPVIQGYEATRALAYEYDQHRDRLPKNLRANLDEAAKVTPEAYDEARATTHKARRALADLMADYDAILTPSAVGAAPLGLESTGLAIFNRLWTLLGPPCVNVPGLADDQGLPLGVQMVGHFGRDRDALEAARFLEWVMLAA